MKRIISLLVVIALSCTMISCSKSGENEKSENKPGTVVSENEKSITIVDQANREVKVPKKVDSIALCYRVIVRFLLSLEQGDKITGIGKTEDFIEKLQPSLKDAKSIGQGVVDMEALAELSPDLFFHKASDVETLDSVQELGIPAIGISVENTEDMLTALEIMGKVCGATKKADKLIKYYKDKVELDKDLTKDIKNKKTAIIMGSSIGKVADGTMLQSHMIEMAGGVNMAADVEATELWPTVGTEQIFQWNPDYIFVTNSESSNYTVKDILKDPNWQELEAVKKKNVYTMPAIEDSWEFPGIVSVLGVDYMMRIMYPKILSDTQLEKNVNEFYDISYGKKFEREQLGY